MAQEFAKKFKVALVHDQLNQAGGAERVLFALTKIFPEAPIYTLIYDKKRMGGFENSQIKTSLIQKMPFGVSKFKWYLPLMPIAVERFNFSQYDLVISSTSALIKGIITGPNTLHISYCHTPTRWLWAESGDYVEDLNAPKLIKKILPAYLSKLRQWDQLAAQRVNHYIANSQCVANRIENYYNRQSDIIYPPVDTDNYKLSEKIGDYYLMAGRLRPYKKFDIAIKAFNKLGLKLKIIGAGEEYENLKKIAGPSIEFLGAVDEVTKREIFARCIAFINPQVEDFGMTMVESLSSGRPVIAYAGGGALEQIREGFNGTFIHDQSWEAIVDAILHFKPEMYNPPAIQQDAQKYNWREFNRKIIDLISKKLADKNTSR